jgi:hypothetical protein
MIKSLISKEQYCSSIDDSVDVLAPDAFSGLDLLCCTWSRVYGGVGVTCKEIRFKSRIGSTGEYSLTRF